MEDKVGKRMEDRKETFTTYIFDLDGTLLDTLEDLTDAANYTMEHFGCQTRTLEEIRSFVGNGIARLVALCLPGGKENPDFEPAVALFKEYYAAHCNDKTRPYPGVMDMLAALREKGKAMAIVSNKGDFAVKELARLYFQDYIPVAIGEKESEGIRKKPAPDTVFEALRQLGRKPEEAVYVGDSEVDLKTAKNAGLSCVACSWGFRERSFLEELGPEWLIDDPAGLLQI